MKSKPSQEIKCVMSGQPVVPGKNGKHMNIGPVHESLIPEYNNMMNAIWSEMHAEECDLCSAARKIAKICIEQNLPVTDAARLYRERIKKS